MFLSFSVFQQPLDMLGIFAIECSFKCFMHLGVSLGDLAALLLQHSLK